MERCSWVLEHCKLVAVLQGHCSLVQGPGHCNLVLETLQERCSLVLVQNSLVTEKVLEHYRLEMVNYNLVMALRQEVHCSWELVVPQVLGSLVQERCNLVLEQGDYNLVQENYNLVLVLEHCSLVLEVSYNLMQVVLVENHIGLQLVVDCNLWLVLVRGRCSLVQVEHCNLVAGHCNWELELGHYSLVQEEHCNLERVVHCSLALGQVHCSLKQGGQYRLELEVHCSLVQVLGQEHCN